MKILISTFEPGPEDLFAAMTAIGYDKLVLVMEEKHASSKDFLSVKEAVEYSKGQIESIIVSRYDFMDCFNKIVGYVAGSLAPRKGSKQTVDAISINISCGSKIMSDAAMLAAFYLGVPGYYCRPGKTVRLPVLTGVTIKDRFSEPQLKVMKALKKHGTVDALEKALSKELSKSAVDRSLAELRSMGMVKINSTGSGLATILTEPGTIIADTLERFASG